MSRQTSSWRPIRLAKPPHMTCLSFSDMRDSMRNDSERGPVRCAAPGDAQFVQCAWSGVTVVRDISDGRVVATLAEDDLEISAVCRSPDGAVFVFGAMRGGNPTLLVRRWPFRAAALDDVVPLSGLGRVKASR